MHDDEVETFPVNRFTPKDFAALGMGRVAYVKPLSAKEFSIHDADGTPLTTIRQGRDVAFASVRQHAMEPLSVH